jgi:hypothetical protein
VITETAPASVPATLFRPVSRAMAEDRWLGLMLDRVDPDLPSDLSNRLVAIIAELAGGMGRESADNCGIQDDLSEVISEWLVMWAMAGGVSPTDAAEFVTFTGAPRRAVKGGVA